MTFPSTKMAVFVDGMLFLRLSSMKMDDFVDGMLFLRLSSMKMDDFVDGKVADKKETPSKGCLCVWR